MKRIVLCLLTLIFVFLSVDYVSANSECSVFLRVSSDQVQKGEELNLGLYINSASDINIATFRIKVYFDETKLKFRGIEAKNNINTSEFKYYEENNTVTLIYLESGEGINIKSGEESGILDFKFKVLDTASAGTLEFSAKIDGIGDNNVNEIFCSDISPINFNILDPVYSSCRLKSLEVSSGTLVPEFDPYITEYNLSVPYDVKSIEVYATPQDSSDSVRVNRKTLGSGGSYTDINVTVTSQDKKTKLVYKITVYRGAKDSSSSSNTSNTSRTSKTSQSIGSGKSGASSPSNSSGNTSRKTNSLQKSVGSEGTYTDGNGAENSILLKNNTFLSFIFGTLISAVAGIIIYIIYKYRHGPKGKHEVEQQV